jgi:SAM-dependent methyltransferase
MDGVLVSLEASTAWAVQDGLPRLCREAATTPGRTRLEAWENFAPRLHDPVVRLLPQVLGGGGGAARQGMFNALDLRALNPGARVLEVGVATGHNLSPLLDAIPNSAKVELWGTDTRAGLLAQCQDRCSDDARLQAVRLLMASPERLPFLDDTFDRVLYVGGVHGQADPAGVVAELARVTRDDGVVLVVDERADASGGVTGWRRRVLASLGATEAHTCPLSELAPADAQDVQTHVLDPVLEAMSLRPAARGM